MSTTDSYRLLTIASKWQISRGGGGVSCVVIVQKLNTHRPRTRNGLIFKSNTKRPRRCQTDKDRPESQGL